MSCSQEQKACYVYAFRGWSAFDQNAVLFDKISKKTSRIIRIQSLPKSVICQESFGFDLPSVLWAKRMQKFEVKFALYLSS